MGQGKLTLLSPAPPHVSKGPGGMNDSNTWPLPSAFQGAGRPSPKGNLLDLSSLPPDPFRP